MLTEMFILLREEEEEEDICMRTEAAGRQEHEGVREMAQNGEQAGGVLLNSPASGPRGVSLTQAAPVDGPNVCGSKLRRAVCWQARISSTQIDQSRAGAGLPCPCRIVFRRPKTRKHHTTHVFS